MGGQDGGIGNMRAELDAERMRVEAMPNGPEKEAALAALLDKEEELRRMESMPDGPEKDTAFMRAKIAVQARAELVVERKRIEAMPNGPENEAA